MRRRLVGSMVGVACVVVFGAVLLPLRAHLAISTTGLILVIPVVFGAAIGDFIAGTLSVVAGFLVYDYEFIPPYRTLSVGTLQNWIALAVYVIVMLLVAQVVSRLNHARGEAQRGNEVMGQLSELSELLVGDQPTENLLRTIVTAAQRVFDLPGVSLLILEDGSLRVAASAGEPLTSDELRRLDPQSGTPVSVGTAADSRDEVRTIALSAAGRPVGLLAMRGLPVTKAQRAVLMNFANDAALALERARLREQALRSQLLEEVDRLRSGLMGAVSHDLRTPLATIKVASSTLANRASTLSLEDSQELHHLIEVETDHLTRLVTNLLDMTRIEAGVLTAHPVETSLTELVDEALRAMGSALSETPIALQVPDSLPDVDVDRLLVGQVLVNLLDNAVRHSPIGGVITLAATLAGEHVELSVADEGPGVAPGDREAVFDRFKQFDTGGRAGLGLTIARTFVEALGERIWCDEAPGGGARFAFTLPIARAKS